MLSLLLLSLACPAPRATTAAPLQSAPPSEPAGDPPLADSDDPQPTGPALTIDGEPIPFDDFARWLLRFRGESAVPAFLSSDAIESRAAALGLTLGEEEIRARVESEIEERVRLAFGGRVEEWQQELARLGSSPERHRLQRQQELRPQMLADRIARAERVVTEEQIRQAFEREFGLGGRRLWVRRLSLRLRVSTPPGTPQVERQRRNQEAQFTLRARLTRLRERALAGEDFRALIQKESEDPDSKAAEAEAFQTDRWPQATLEALAPLQLGQLSEPIYGRGFFHLFRLEREERTELADVRAQILARLNQREASAQEIAALVESARAAAQVELLPALWSDSTDMREPVLRIEQREITRGDYARWLARRQGSALARAFVEERLCAQLLREAGIEIGETEVDARIESEIQALVERFHEGDAAAWEEALRAQGNSPERLRRERRTRTRLDLGVERLMQVGRSVPPSEVEQLWQLRFGKGGRSLDVRVLARKLQFPEGAARLPAAEQQRLIERARAATLAQLGELRERVLAGEDLASLSEGANDYPPRESAFDFDYWKWPPEARGLLDELRPGELSPAYALGDTCFLFQLLDERIVPLKTVAQALEVELLETPPSAAERAGFLNELVEAHTWTLFPENFPAPSGS